MSEETDYMNMHEALARHQIDVEIASARIRSVRGGTPSFEHISIVVRSV